MTNSWWCEHAWLPGGPTADVRIETGPKGTITAVQPGTPAFRVALRDAIATTKEVVGTHGVYNFKAGNVYGVDERARVVVKVDNGTWKYVP